MYMIIAILDCINGISESNLNEEGNLFFLNDLCNFNYCNLFSLAAMLFQWALCQMFYYNFILTYTGFN